MLVTPFGIVRDLRLLHFLNACAPIVFKFLESLMVFKLLHDVNASLPIVYTLLGIISSVTASLLDNPQTSICLIVLGN